VDLLVGVHVEGPLDEGEGHLQGLHPQLRAVLRDELEPLDAHQPTVAGGILLQVLHMGGGAGERAGNTVGHSCAETANLDLFVGHDLDEQLHAMNDSLGSNHYIGLV